MTPQFLMSPTLTRRSEMHQANHSGVQFSCRTNVRCKGLVQFSNLTVFVLCLSCVVVVVLCRVLVQCFGYRGAD